MLVNHSAALLRIPTQSKSYRSVGCCVSLRRAKGPTPDRPHTRPAPHPTGPTPARPHTRPGLGPAGPGAAAAAGGQAINAAAWCGCLYLLVRIYS
jgi:hypothetical protein